MPYLPRCAWTRLNLPLRSCPACGRSWRKGGWGSFIQRHAPCWANAFLLAQADHAEELALQPGCSIMVGETSLSRRDYDKASGEHFDNNDHAVKHDMLSSST